MTQGALTAIDPRPGWSWEPLGYLAPRVAEDGHGDLEPLSVYLGAGVVRRADREDNHNVLGADMDKYLRVLPGDLVFNKLRTWQGGLGASKYEGIVSPAYYVLRPGPRLEPRFAHYLLVSTPYLAELTRLSKFMPPSQFDMPWEALKRLAIALPPVEEQRRLADFLDDQVARIDEAMDARDQQLSLIDARFDATLKNLVLGRGSQSLGWADGIGDDRVLLPLGRLMMLRGEKNDPVRVHQILSLTAKRGVIPYEEKGDIGNKASEDISRYSIVQPGDIVVNSMNVVIGSVGLSEYEGVLSPVYYVMMPVPNPRALPEFVALHFRIREFQQQLIKLGYGILQHRMRIPWINLKAERLAVPSLEKQREVVDALGSLDADRKASLATVQSGIDLLEERKRALITAAVTGELDVTTAKPIGMGKWVPNVGAGVEAPAAPQAGSIGGIG